MLKCVGIIYICRNVYIKIFLKCRCGYNIDV